jgi:hypothetical protein
LGFPGKEEGIEVLNVVLKQSAGNGMQKMCWNFEYCGPCPLLLSMKLFLCGFKVSAEESEGAGRQLIRPSYAISA